MESRELLVRQSPHGLAAKGRGNPPLVLLDRARLAKAASGRGGTSGQLGWNPSDGAIRLHAMERGPYDRPPPGQPPQQPGQPGQQPGYPQQGAQYQQPAGYEPEPPPERRFGWVEIVALVAVVVAVVAIFLAIDARNSSSSDEEIAAQVQQETQRQVSQIRSEAGGQLESADQTARKAESKADATAEKNQESVSRLESQVSELRGEVSALKSQQNQMRSTLQKQSEDIADIRRTLREGG
jgi:hypothetical protein